MSATEQATQTQATEQAQSSESQSETRQNVDMLTFIEAWETSIDDGTNLQGVADKTGLTQDTCQARASKYRNPEYERANKTVTKDGQTLTVFKRSVAGPNGEQETTNKDEAKQTTQGKPVPVQVYKLDKDKNKIVKRRAIPLRTMPRGGFARLETKVDDAFELLAKLRGQSVDEVANSGDSDES